MHSGTATIAGLIFDMDGLLADSEPVAARAMLDFLRRHGKTARPDLLGRLLGRRVPEAIAIVAAEYDLPGPLADLEATFNTLRYAALRGNLRPMPGAEALITFARSAGLRLALATSNLRRHVDLTLAEVRLAGLFDAEVTGDEVSRGKPEPDIFLLAAERIGVEPARAVVLEDSPVGIAAAKAAGMAALWVPHVGSRDLPLPVPPDATLPDLSTAIPWLEARGVRVVHAGRPVSPAET